MIASYAAAYAATAVVFFGDHLPAVWGEKTREKNDPLTLRQTPYFLWTNFEKLPARSEEVTSPIYFLPMLWRELGLELPAYYNLLLALHAARLRGLDQLHRPPVAPAPVVSDDGLEALAHF